MAPTVKGIADKQTKIYTIFASFTNSYTFSTDSMFFLLVPFQCKHDADVVDLDIERWQHDQDSDDTRTRHRRDGKGASGSQQTEIGKHNVTSKPPSDSQQTEKGNHSVTCKPNIFLWVIRKGVNVVLWHRD